MLLFALQWGGIKYAWGSATIIGLFCGSAGNFAVFLAWEYKKGDDAMIPFSMIKIRIVWCSCFIMLFFFGTQIITSYYLALYFQAVRGVTPTLSGVYLLPTILSQMLLAIISGVLGWFILVALLGIVLTVISRPPWVLYALGYSQCSLVGNWLRSTIYLYAYHINRNLDRVSNHWCRRSRLRNANGNHLLPSLLTP